MKYFVGVDQGGSKTEIIIGNQNGILIDKYIGVGYIEFIRELKDGSEFQTKYLEQQIKYLKELLSRNNLELSDVYALVSSMATINNDNIKTSFETDLCEKTSIKNVSVYNDMYGAWRAGTNKRPSGVIAIGTGTGIMFFHENGSSTDLSSKIKYQAARELGYRAFLHACFSSLKLLETTILTEKICEFAQTSTIEEALKNTKNGHDITALSHQFFVPYVYEAALKKDRVAEDFVNEVGIGLAKCIRVAIKDFGWENQEVPLVLNGGSFKGNGYIMEKIIKDNLIDFPNLQIIQAKCEPVYGALMLAYEKYNDGIIPKVKKEDIVKFEIKRIL